jgi:hypothetical protein
MDGGRQHRGCSRRFGDDEAVRPGERAMICKAPSGAVQPVANLLHAVHAPLRRCTANSPAISAACRGSVWPTLVGLPGRYEWLPFICPQRGRGPSGEGLPSRGAPCGGTTALAGPHRLMPVLVPAVVPLVPSNKANESSLHGAALPTESTLRIQASGVHDRGAITSRTVGWS